MSRVLIKGGTVLSMDRTVGNLMGGDVLIDDGVVAEVGQSLRARNAETIDASGTIVMPGFVDTHRHLWHSLFRNGGRGAGLSPAGVGPHYDADATYAATLIGLLAAAEAGITTVVDWADLPAELASAALQAHADAGLRSVFVASGAEWGETAPDPARLRAALGGDLGPRQNLAFGADHADDLEAASKGWATARSEGLRIHAHAGRDGSSRGSVARLDGAGLLGADVTLVHCTNLDDADLDAIASSKAGVSLTPALEMTDAYGMPPLQGLLDRGIRPGLGVGSELEAPGDIFAQMRAANSVQHATLFDLKLAGKGGVPNLLSTREVIRYATIDGAAAAGLADATGSLAPGKRADVLVLRADRPNIAPVNDPIGAVVWGMDTSNIDWVFVDGSPVVREGELATDTAGARDLAVAAQRRIGAAAGLFAEEPA